MLTICKFLLILLLEYCSYLLLQEHNFPRWVKEILSPIMYLVAESLAGQAKLSSAHFNRHMAHLLSTTGFGPAHNPGRQTAPRQCLIKLIPSGWHFFKAFYFSFEISVQSTSDTHKNMTIKTLPPPPPSTSWSVPGGDLIEAGDDSAGNPGYWNRVEDVFSLLAQVGAWDGDCGAAFQQAREWLNLREGRKCFFFKETFWMHVSINDLFVNANSF